MTCRYCRTFLSYLGKARCGTSNPVAALIIAEFLYRYWRTFLSYLGKAQSGSLSMVRCAQQRRLLWQVRYFDENQTL